VLDKNYAITNHTVRQTVVCRKSYLFQHFVIHTQSSCSGDIKF